MSEKTTSLKVKPELWKKTKLLAIRRGVTLKSLIEKLLSSEVEAEEKLESKELKASTELLEALTERRKKGLIPFTITSEKSAVELVREGRGR